MPFSDEKRKCPICGGYEAWNLMTHINGGFCCQDCYIRLFEKEEPESKNSEVYKAMAEIIVSKPEIGKLLEETITTLCNLTTAMCNTLSELDWAEILKRIEEKDGSQS